MLSVSVSENKNSSLELLYYMQYGKWLNFKIIRGFVGQFTPFTWHSIQEMAKIIEAFENPSWIGQLRERWKEIKLLLYTKSNGSGGSFLSP